MSVSVDLKKRLSDFLISWLKEQPGKQKEWAELLRVSPPRLNNLLKEKLHLFSVDSLIELLYRAGFVFSTVSEDGTLTVKIVKI